jgi:heme A synthase
MSSSPRPILTVRSTLVLLLAVLVGVAAGVLASMAGQSLPAAVLVAGGAAGFTVVAATTLVEP